MSAAHLESAWAKPKTVHLAVVCLAISSTCAALLAVALGTGLLHPPSGASNFANVLGVAILALATWKIAAGRGWARWLFVIVYALGVLAGGIMFLVRPEPFLAWSMAMVASSLIQTALQTAALAFLFTPSSREWFRSRRVRSPSQTSGAA
jgi:hypothetical protein